MVNSGIYKIVNKINNKYYIGSAVNFTVRWQSHRWHLNNNRHVNLHLQRAWNLDGAASFEFIIVEYVDKINDLESTEQKYLNELTENSYNICKIAGTKLNVPMSQETKNKISAANKGHAHGMTGQEHSDETKWLMSAVQKGITNRNLEKWPCANGYYCKCEKCKAKRNGQYLIAKYAREAKRNAKIKL